LTVALLAFAGAAGLVGLLPAPSASAATLNSAITESTTQTGEAIGLTSTDLPTYVGRLINYVLGLLGVIALILIIYAGFLYMTSGGVAEKVDKAKKLMVDAVIGLLLIFAAYSIALFIMNMLFGATGFGGGSGTSASATPLYSSTRGRGAMGNGLLDYHYPESGQTNVPRNTKISVTFKRPIVLSTVLKDYDDKGTFDTSDDLVNRGGWVLVASLPLEQRVYDLKSETIRLFAHENLGSASGTTVDAQFDTLYPVDKMVTGFKVRVTDTPPVYDPLVEQTVSFKPNDYLGSASTAMNYRVALRGGDTGVKVWDKPSKVGEVPPQKPAFPQAYPNGGYYWNFTTGTILDLTPPQLTYTYPAVAANPSSQPVFRNQLLQAYFDEPMDPTTASGNAARGYTQMGVEAASVAGGSYAPVPGEFVVGNRYRTVEFVPSGPCDTAGGTVAVNSCGDAVTCLPRNADLRVYGLAASVSVSDLGSRPAATADNGLEDMAGNSFDGNHDGQTQGPEQSPVQTDGRPSRYDLNNALNAPLTNASDTAQWRYRVNDSIDLTPPTVTAIDPPPVNADYPAGRNRIPPELAPSFIWSKVMSISSIRTGGYDETTNDFTEDDSTIVLRSREMEKQAGSPACPGTAAKPCVTVRLEPPSFYAETEIATVPTPHSRIYLRHPGRAFYKANDLGFTFEEQQGGYDSTVPIYVPIARARLRDTLQNCFYPSYYKPTPTATECGSDTAGQTSCCDISANSDTEFKTKCSP
jgi:hypothetical protein